VALCSAFAVHVADEAVNDFLSIYNYTVLAIRESGAWFPFPLLEFRGWLATLVIVIALLFALSPFAFRGAGWLRSLAYVFAVVMLLNGIGHTLGTIAGQTVASVRFPRPMPGFYSSPLLLAAAVYLLMQLSRTRPPGRT
jgi:hypothetical protein